jgi:hypothetical protein
MTSYARCPFQVQRLAQVTMTSNVSIHRSFGSFPKEKMMMNSRAIGHLFCNFFCSCEVG